MYTGKWKENDFWRASKTTAATSVDAAIKIYDTCIALSCVLKGTCVAHRKTSEKGREQALCCAWVWAGGLINKAQFYHNPESSQKWLIPFQEHRHGSRTGEHFVLDFACPATKKFLLLPLPAP